MSKAFVMKMKEYKMKTKPKAKANKTTKKVNKQNHQKSKPQTKQTPILSTNVNSCYYISFQKNLSSIQL